MESIVALLLLSPALAAGSLHALIDNGLAKTLRWSGTRTTTTHAALMKPIIYSNAKALVDLGLSSLGYRYVTTDCGWSVANRLPNGTLTWNETLFPSKFPAMGEYLHGLGLLLGVYGDAGIKLCGSPLTKPAAWTTNNRMRKLSLIGERTR